MNNLASLMSSSCSLTKSILSPVFFNNAWSLVCFFWSSFFLSWNMKCINESIKIQIYYYRIEYIWQKQINKLWKIMAEHPSYVPEIKLSLHSLSCNRLSRYFRSKLLRFPVPNLEILLLSYLPYHALTYTSHHHIIYTILPSFQVPLVHSV